jgi:hypothetical protein
MKLLRPALALLAVAVVLPACQDAALRGVPEDFDVYSDECGIAHGPAALPEEASGADGMPEFGAGDWDSLLTRSWMGVMYTPAVGFAELEVRVEVSEGQEPPDLTWYPEGPPTGAELCPPRVEQVRSIEMSGGLALDEDLFGTEVDMPLASLGLHLMVISGEVQVDPGDLGPLVGEHPGPLRLRVDFLEAPRVLNGSIFTYGAGPQEYLAEFSLTPKRGD